MVMHLNEFSDALIARAESWRELWGQRMVIGADTLGAQVIPFKKAA
jgi:hypothetical protein